MALFTLMFLLTAKRECIGLHFGGVGVRAAVERAVADATAGAVAGFVVSPAATATVLHDWFEVWEDLGHKLN